MVIIISVVVLILIYFQIFKTENVQSTGSVNASEDEDEDLAEAYHYLKRRSLRRASLKLPRITLNDDTLSVSHDWNESQFHTPQPYKTPSPKDTTSQNKIVFTEIPIIRT